MLWRLTTSSGRSSFHEVRQPFGPIRISIRLSVCRSVCRFGRSLGSRNLTTTQADRLARTLTQTFNASPNDRTTERPTYPTERQTDRQTGRQKGCPDKALLLARSFAYPPPRRRTVAAVVCLEHNILSKHKARTHRHIVCERMSDRFADASITSVP